VKLTEDEGHGKKKTTKNPMEMDFSDWLLSWDNYALTAALLKQMSYASAVTHKHVVSEIAKKNLKNDERVAVIYDYMIRSPIAPQQCVHYHNCLLSIRAHWEDESGKLGSAFLVDALVSQRDEALYTRACATYDRIFGHPVQSGYWVGTCPPLLFL
jgi:hypothetical protein